MLYSSEIHTKHINTLCGQNVELLNVAPGSTCCNDFDLKGLTTIQLIKKCCTVIIITKVQSSFQFQNIFRPHNTFLPTPISFSVFHIKFGI
jgi:hypothetical protein